MKWTAAAICTVPLMAKPTALTMRNTIIMGMLRMRAKPTMPMPMSTLLTISSQILLSRSAMNPQKGRHTRLVMENRPTTTPAKAMVAPRLTRYLDMIVAVM